MQTKRSERLAATLASVQARYTFTLAPARDAETAARQARIVARIAAIDLAAAKREIAEGAAPRADLSMKARPIIPIATPQDPETEGTGMLLTLGIENALPEHLIKITSAIGAERTRIIDVRHNAKRSRNGWSSGNLTKLFGASYDHRLDLSDMEQGDDWPALMSEIAARVKSGEKIILLGYDIATANCHRYMLAELAGEHGIDALHLYGKEVLSHSELRRAIAAGDDYDCEHWIDYTQLPAAIADTLPTVVNESKRADKRKARAELAAAA